MTTWAESILEDNKALREEIKQLKLMIVELKEESDNLFIEYTRAKAKVVANGLDS